MSIRKWFATLTVLGLIVLLFAGMASAQETNMIYNGDLEINQPFWWSVDQTGGELNWVNDEAQTGLRSLQIVKVETGEAASWVSGNQAQTFWNHMEASTYTVSAWMKTENVNTDPANDDAKVGVVFYFYNGQDLLGETSLWADQTSATTDWTEYTGEVVLLDAPDNAYIKCVMGAEATGTAWFDHFNYSSDPWTAGAFGGSAENPVGWMSWSDGDNGFAAAVEYGEAHSGNYCAKLEELDTDGDEMVFYSTPAAVEEGEDYLVSVWIKTEDCNISDDYYATNVIPVNIQERFNLCFFFHSGDIDHEWSPTGGDQFLYPVQTEIVNEWTKYMAIVTAPEGATGFSMRARFNPTVTGTVYFDDFSLEHVTGDNLVENADLETLDPFWWSAGQTGGTLNWVEGDASDGDRSLQIVKDQTGTAASWVSGNQAQTFWNHLEATTYTVSAWMKTDNVNIDPATDDARIGVKFYFFNGENSLGEATLWADQSTAATDWTEYTTEIVLLEAPDNAYIEAVMGSDATGTAWFDQFNYSSDPWTGGVFGASAETPTGWMNWSDGDGGFANMVEYQESHSGTHSAKLEELDDSGDEMVFYSIPFEAEPGSYYEFSVWVKTETVSPLNEAWYPTYVRPDNIGERANLCFFFHTGDINHEWSPVGGDQFIYVQQIQETEDWTQYRAVVQAPEEATGASLRARFNPVVQGTIYFDDFVIRQLDVQELSVDPGFLSGQADLPTTMVLSQNYPNPFNSATTIEFSLPSSQQVQLTVYDVLGRQVAQLANQVMSAGTHAITFDLNAASGLNLGSGVYFYRLSTPDQIAVRKMIYLK